LFTLLGNPVATARQAALIGAIIVIDLIGVIAALSISMNEAITTTRRDAACDTVIIVISIAVIAGFKAQLRVR